MWASCLVGAWPCARELEAVTVFWWRSSLSRKASAQWQQENYRIQIAWMIYIVKAALAKWPNVPDCYGWLGLDARGNWYMRDEQAQVAGPFGGTPGAMRCRNAAAKGSVSAARN
jgi:hypothetical protein